MAYKLTREEQETIIIFNEAEQSAEISTFNGALIRRLTQLCKDRPSECTGDEPDADGEVKFVVPKKWIKVNPKRISSEAQLETNRANLRKASQ